MPFDAQLLIWIIPAFLTGLLFGWLLAGSARRSLGALKDRLRDAEAARDAAETARQKAERDAASARDQVTPLADEVDRLRHAAARRKASAASAEAAPAAVPVAEPAVPATAFAVGEKPPLFMDAPRGTADNLGLLKGVGPKLQAKFNEIGVFHFQQIANWSDADVSLIDSKLDQFKGRIVRDQLIDQAKLLAAGRMTEYEARFGKLDGEDA